MQLHGFSDWLKGTLFCAGLLLFVVTLFFWSFCEGSPLDPSPFWHDIEVNHSTHAYAEDDR